MSKNINKFFNYIYASYFFMNVYFVKNFSITALRINVIKYLITKNILSSKWNNEELTKSFESFYYDKASGPIAYGPDTIMGFGFIFLITIFCNIVNKFTDNVILKFMVSSSTGKYMFIGIGTFLVYNINYFLLYRDKKYLKFYEEFEKEVPKVKLKWYVGSIFYFIGLFFLAILSYYYL